MGDCCKDNAGDGCCQDEAPIVNGLYFDLSGAEIVSAYQASAEHHKSRAAFYETELAKFKLLQSDEDRPNRSLPSSAYGYDPTNQIQDKIESHRRIETRHQILATYVNKNAVYRLSPNDLDSLGLYQ